MNSANADISSNIFISKMRLDLTALTSHTRGRKRKRAPELPEVVVPNFMFAVDPKDPDAFSEVERCIMNQLGGESMCSFLQSATFTGLRRMALYEAGSHKGGIAFTGHGLCVRLFPDNRVQVKWV